MDILGQQDAGAAMSQVVKSYRWQARRPERRLEMVEQVVRLNRGAVAGREYQIAIDPTIAAISSMLISLSLVVGFVATFLGRERPGLSR